jgi:hypothetical protein
MVDATGLLDFGIFSNIIADTRTLPEYSTAIFYQHLIILDNAHLIVGNNSHVVVTA